MLEINEELFKAKKGGEYSRNDISNDFAIPGEITVTITLNEYRSLVSANAIFEKRISDLNSERYGAQAEANALKQEREKLIKEIAELKIKISDLLMETNTPPQDDKGEAADEEAD
ncbi:hypothetical protein [Dialister succinatiphilus]|uniref:hypothetical protein n=1 Tax=Dialister succinatiphilus TaxID=487173 RepID=UPI004026F086